MTGKEILLKALRCEKTERSPWVPFVGSHGAHLLGCDAISYLKSADLIVEAITKSKKMYRIFQLIAMLLPHFDQ